MTTDIANTVIIRQLSLQDYSTCWHAMKRFTQERTETTLDEIWLLEHHPVFTQGQNGKPEHILAAGNIPVIHVDRGGQVTYHGPGQLVAYTLVDLKRKQLNIRQMVCVLENAMQQALAELDIKAEAKRDAPGVYVDHKKIGSVGLRIKRGCAYHGLALNVTMDLEPFTRINPCGYKQLEMTQVSDLQISPTFALTRQKLLKHLTTNLGYTEQQFQSDF